MEEIMKFEINNNEWEIFRVDKDSILDRYNEEHEDQSTYVFGLTIYPEHQIWINDNLCTEEKIRTLKHELAHCYLWSYGFYNTPHFTEEMLCDTVAASNDFINRIVMEFVAEKKF